MGETQKMVKKTAFFSAVIVGLLSPGLLGQDGQEGLAQPTVPVLSAKPSVRVATFCQGLDGYLGTVDTEIWALAGNTLLDKNPNASSDANNDGGESPSHKSLNNSTISHPNNLMNSVSNKLK